jgi:methionyl-tRNA synthetase
MKHKIEFEEFMEMTRRLEIKMGTIVNLERVPKSDKMLKLTVFFGGEEVTVATNIGNKLEDPNVLIGRSFPFVTNLKPAKIMGIESHAMILIPTFADGTPNFDEQPIAGCELI